MIEDSDINPYNDENVDNNAQLEVMGTSIKKSKQKLRNTVFQHFEILLRYINAPYCTIYDIPEETDFQTLLGRFSSYIKECVKSVNSYKSHDIYVSSVHVFFPERYPAKMILIARFYSNLRDEIFDCNRHKERKHAALPSLSDIDYLTRKLFEIEDFQSRGFVVMDIHASGRFCEVSASMRYRIYYYTIKISDYIYIIIRYNHCTGIYNHFCVRNYHYRAIFYYYFSLMIVAWSLVSLNMRVAA